MKRNREFAALVAKAHAAGVAAADAVELQMIQVREASTGRVFEPFPICGFGWVVLRPATSAFAKYLKAQGWKKHWESGIYLWVTGYGQNYDQKYAYAKGYAQVLKDAGYNAYGDGRLD